VGAVHGGIGLGLNLRETVHVVVGIRYALYAALVKAGKQGSAWGFSEVTQSRLFCNLFTMNALFIAKNRGQPRMALT
jgi:hypothetical protein